MQYRRVGESGLLVSEIGFGAATFGASGEFFGAWADTGPDEARAIVDMCLDAGVTLFDTADVYSDGASETVLGQALEGRRDRAVISTKAALPTGDGHDDAGSSRRRLIRAVDAALRRLRTDYIDLFQLHAYDAATPVAEVLDTLDGLVTAGKIRYLGVSNFSGWQLMKSLAAADAAHRTRYIAHQVYYSLIGRDYEWELMPLGLDQGVGALVWSPLGWGRLTGQIRRGAPLPAVSRLHTTSDAGPPVDDQMLFDVIDMLTVIAEECERTIPQVALNWLLSRPTVSSVIVGARNPRQLRDNLGATGWSLSDDQIRRLDEVSFREPGYPHFPYHRQAGFAKLNPPLFPAAGQNSAN